VGDRRASCFAGQVPSSERASARRKGRVLANPLKQVKQRATAPSRVAEREGVLAHPVKQVKQRATAPSPANAQTRVKHVKHSYKMLPDQWLKCFTAQRKRCFTPAA
jgi:hypothetical protein